ncbi:Oleate hydratase [compost metagenome]
MKAAKTLNDDKPFVGEGLLRKVLKGSYFEHILPIGSNENDDHESFVQEQITKFKDWIKGIKG